MASASPQTRVPAGWYSLIAMPSGCCSLPASPWSLQPPGAVSPTVLSLPEQGVMARCCGGPGPWELCRAWRCFGERRTWGVLGCSGRDARLPGTGNMLWLLLNHPLELVVQSSDRLWPDACNLNVARRAGEVSSGHRPLGALDLVFVSILLCTFKVYFKLFS